MKRLKWMIAKSLRRLDWMALIGFSLVMVAMAGHFAIKVPMQSGIDQLERKLAAKKADAMKATNAGKRPVIPPVNTRLNEFYDYFAPKRGVADRLERIYDAASAQSIQLVQGDYKLVQGTTGKLSGYQISLPVRGPYAHVRKFVLQVLDEVPGASLDELAFTRESIGSAELEAKIRFTLYLRTE
jgi:hypothetical protein